MGLRDTTCRRHLSRLHGGCRVARGGCRMARRQDTTCRRQLSRLRGGCRVAHRRWLALSPRLTDRPSLGRGCHNSHRGLGGGRGHSSSHRSEFLDLATFICISTTKLACVMCMIMYLHELYVHLDLLELHFDLDLRVDVVVMFYVLVMDITCL
jgi:hypothetical protein